MAIGQKIEQGDYSLTIKSVALRDSLRQLFLRVDVEGDAEGSIALSGRPAIAEAGKFIYLEDVDYHLLRSDLVLEAADMVYHEEVKKLLAEKLVLPYADWLTIKGHRIEKSLEKGETGKYIDFEVGDLELELKECTVQNGFFLLLLDSEPRMRLNVKRL